MSFQIKRLRNYSLLEDMDRHTGLTGLSTIVNSLRMQVE
jgi:hypothetical protein